ncbi:hypothetical protein SD10_12635 [Spirosoma radiotolerans]|uniref:Uncharacterized protein n=1 Tax=Spirosoma radiotolerans TaxID=1379870 RepID=A0A0E3ZWC0_9BACT|nr:hypothetical protein SD10_12635 [Spirosoma radiotolerans]
MNELRNNYPIAEIPIGRHLPVDMGITILKVTIETVSMITEGFCLCDRHNRDKQSAPSALRKKFIANRKSFRVFMLILQHNSSIGTAVYAVCCTGLGGFQTTKKRRLKVRNELLF